MDPVIECQNSFLNEEIPNVSNGMHRLLRNYYFEEIQKFPTECITCN